MKNLFILLIFLLTVIHSGAQLVIGNGGSLVVTQGTNLTATGGIISNNGSINNKGVIRNLSDLVNNGSSLFTVASTGTFKFAGSTAQEISGNHDAGFYGILVIDNPDGVSLTSISTGSDQSINGTLQFVNGLLVLNDFDLTIGNIDPASSSTSRYICTNAAGKLLRLVPADGTTLLLFPIGNSSYNPVTLQNSATGASDIYGIKVLDHEPADAETPHFVDRCWVVTESVPGGSALTVKAQWDVSQELLDFDRYTSGIGVTTDDGASYEWKAFELASGSGPYTQSGSIFWNTGTFAIADYYFTIPDNITVSGTTISNNEIDCFEAKETIVVAGDGTEVIIEPGGEGIFVAGETIYFRNGFKAQEGSMMLAYITTTDQFCGYQPPSMVSTVQNPGKETVQVPEFTMLDQKINLYPNPTNGRFWIELLNFSSPAQVHLLNFQGQEILRENTAAKTMEFDLSSYPDGMYFVTVRSANKILTKKVILQ